MNKEEVKKFRDMAATIALEDPEHFAVVGHIGDMSMMLEQAMHLLVCQHYVLDTGRRRHVCIVCGAVYPDDHSQCALAPLLKEWERKSE